MKIRPDYIITATIALLLVIFLRLVAWISPLFLIVFICTFFLFVGYRVAFGDYQLKDVINPKKGISLLYGYFMQWAMPPHIIEQLTIRLYDNECRKCVEAGKCSHCGCSMPEKAYVPWEQCSDNMWGPMIMEVDKYKALRDHYPVTIIVKYNDDNSQITSLGNLQSIGGAADFRDNNKISTYEFHKH